MRFLPAALGCAWFMFAAKSVAVLVSPTPDALSVDGGLVIRFGPRYLLLPGTYTVRASLPEYEPLEETFEVDDRRSQTVQVTMVRLPDRLFVDTGEVTGAQVSLDGKVAGDTPLEDKPIRPGRYRLIEVNDAGVLVICAGGGGIPVTLHPDGRVSGVEAVLARVN